MPETQDDQLLIGRLALHYKLVTPEQLAEATRRQMREGGRQRIGEILVESGLITPQRFEQLLAAQRELLARRQAAQTADAAPARSPAPAAALDTSPDLGLLGALGIDRLLQ